MEGEERIREVTTERCKRGVGFENRKDEGRSRMDKEEKKEVWVKNDG